MKVKFTKRDVSIILATVLIALFVVNLLASRHFARIDLTEGREYTLSKSTKDLLKNLDDVITIRVYFTKEVPPAILQLKRMVEDILDEYTSYAGNKIHIEYKDPTETPLIEREVQMMGIPPVQLNVIERDKRELAKVYLGIAVLFGDNKQVIPVVQSPGNLEYDLTSAILKVSSKEPLRIAWWAPQKTSDTGRDPYEPIKKFLENRYSIVAIDPAKPNLDPKREAALVIVNPTDTTPEMQYAIDQYLMNDGKVIALINTVEVSNNLQVSPVTSGLNQLFEHYGASVEEKIIVDQVNAYAAFGGGYITYQVPYPFWPMVRRGSFDEGNPIVSGLEALVFPWASPIKLTEPLPEGISATVLAKTSPHAGTLAIAGLNLSPDAAQMALRDASGGEKPLTVLVTGKFKSYFADKEIPKGISATEQKKEGENASLIIVGDARIIQGNFLNQFRDDLTFFENAVDYMALGDQLIGIRTRLKTDRPLDDLSDATRTTVKYLNTLGAPVIVVGIGALVFAQRRQKRKVLQSIYKK